MMMTRQSATSTPQQRHVTQDQVSSRYSRALASILLSCGFIGATGLAALANPVSAPPSFFSMPRPEAPPVEPRLAVAPDVVKAFGLDSMPELYRRSAAVAPELPRLSYDGAAPAFPDRPYIPDLFGAEKCPERGSGFYRIRGTASCIHVGGVAGVGVEFGSRRSAGAFTYGRIQADIVTPTEIGDLTLTMAVQGAMSSTNNGPIYVGPRNRPFP